MFPENDQSQQQPQHASSYTPLDPHGVNPNQPQKIHHRSQIPEKVEQIVIFVYFVIAAVLLFRFVLALFGANQESIFVNFVYQLSSPFMFPFELMFGGPVGVGNFRLEFEVIVALVVYALIFFGLARLVKILFK